MTEQACLACTDPTAMLEYLRGKASDRKLRLYLCGGCRCVAHLFFKPESLAAVEVAERFADGEASEEELDRAEWDAESPAFGYEFQKEGFSYSSPVKTEVIPRLVEMGVLSESTRAGDEWQVEDAVRERLTAAAELAEFCAVRSPRESDWGFKYISKVDWPSRWLFDCVFGNPFRPVAIDPAWLTPVVLALALSAYDERDLPAGTLNPTRLAELAGALQDAGCTDADILAHCRGPGPHVRGCWAVDLVLGKK